MEGLKRIPTKMRWIGGLGFAVIIGTAFGFIALKRSGPSGRPFQTVPLERGDLVLSIPATGVIEPRFSVEIKSKASGEIARIFKEEGDSIEKGETLVQIDPGIEEIGVRMAKADLMAAEATVKREEILLAKARLAKSRKEALHKKGFISDEEKEEGVHEAALREADLTLAQSQLLRVRETLSEAETRLRETRVLSPLSGVILGLYVERGQIIASGISSFSQGTPLAVVGDLSTLQVRAEVDETDARRVALNQKALVHLDAFPDRPYRARIIRVAPLARAKDDLAVVELLLSLEGLVDASDAPLPLRPGLSADVEVITQRLSGVLLLAREAVHQKEGKWGVAVLAGETVSFHEVKIGASDEERLEIQTDLPAGTEVVIAGGASEGPPQERAGRGRP